MANTTAVLPSPSFLINSTLIGTASIQAAVSASGSSNFDLSGTSGTFLTPTGIGTFGGSANNFTNAVTIAATTNQITLGATAHKTILTSPAPAGASNTITIPDTAGADTFVMTTLAQTLANKTLTAPVLNGASSASGNFDLSGSSGTFKTTTGASTFGGSTNTFSSGAIGASSGQQHTLPAVASDTLVVKGATQTLTGAFTFSNPIVGAAPTLSTHLTTKGYVDSAIQGLDIKIPVIVLSAANQSTLVGALTIDGVVLIATNRVLLTGQSTASENGIWVVAVGSWTRPADFATGSSADGSFVFVEQGTVYKNTGWVCTTATPNDVVDTNNLTFAQFSGAGSYTAGNGIGLSGTAFSIDTSITVDKTTAQTLTNKTLTSPVLGGTVTGTYNIAGTPTLTSTLSVDGGVDMVAVGGTSDIDWSLSSGILKTPAGVNTFGGSANNFTAAVTIAATTNQITLGATAHKVIITSPAPAGASNTLTISDTAGADTFAMVTLAQTLASKTLTAPVINGATSSGSTAIDFSGNSGAFKTSTGASTFGGSSNAFSAAITQTILSIATAQTIGLTNTNTTAAAAGAQQYSPMQAFIGQGWKTDATAASQAVAFAQQTRPVQGTAAPSALFDILYAVNGGSYSVVSSFLSGGGLSTASVGPSTTQQHTLPAVTSDTVALLAASQTFTNKTLTTPIINGASSASGNFDLSGSSGTFKTTTGAGTFGGSANTFTNAVTIAATSNQLSLGAASHIVIISSTAPAGASNTLTIPDTAGADTFVMTTLAQTLASKTLTAPIINGLTSSGSTSIDFSGNSGTFKTTTDNHTFGSATWAVPANLAVTGASSATNTVGMLLTPNVTDGSSTIALKVNNTAALTSTARLLSLQSNASEKFAVLALGGILAPTIGTTTAIQHTIPGGTSSTIAILNKTQTFTAAQGVSPSALTDASSIATDASLSNVFTVTLGGNRTLANPTNLVSGFTYIWIITQDGTGSRTLAYGTTFAWPNSSAPILQTGVNAVDIISAVYDGTHLQAAYLGTPVNPHSTEQTVTAAATITLTASSGETIRIPLSATAITTINGAAGATGQTMRVEMIQDGTGNRAISGWSSGTNGFLLANNSFSVTTNANKRDVLTFMWDSVAAKWVECGRTQSM